MADADDGDLTRRKRSPGHPPTIAPHPQRPDIQALRALAVMSVVLFHLWPNRLPGGFVGVDVFFVISGYLITSHLCARWSTPGGSRLGRFWAARARRLLPASLLELLVTAVAVVLLVPGSRWDQFLSEIIGVGAATCRTGCWPSNSVDYLAADNVPSPAQHFWSLSVEEQFYVALPLLMLPGDRRRQGRGRMPRLRLVPASSSPCRSRRSATACT